MRELLLEAKCELVQEGLLCSVTGKMPKDTLTPQTERVSGYVPLPPEPQPVTSRPQTCRSIVNSKLRTLAASGCKGLWSKSDAFGAWAVNIWIFRLMQIHISEQQQTLGLEPRKQLYFLSKTCHNNSWCPSAAAPSGLSSSAPFPQKLLWCWFTVGWKMYCGAMWCILFV